MGDMKVKIIKYPANSHTCFECDKTDVAQSATGWTEVDHPALAKLRDAILWANINKDSKWHYEIIQEVQDHAEIFKTAAEFWKHHELQEKQRKLKEAADKRARAAKSKERKLKQLEKLKRELLGGQENSKAQSRASL